jgi:hypothetical protein
MFLVLSVFGRHIKGMIVTAWAGLDVQRDHRPLLSPSDSRNKLGTPRCNARRILLCSEARDESSDHHSISRQSLATYGAAVCDNSTSVYPPLLLLWNVMFCYFSAGCLAPPPLYITITHRKLKVKSPPIPAPCFWLHWVPPRLLYHYDWCEQLELGSGCTVRVRLSGVYDQQLTIYRQNILGWSAVLSCAWELTLLFSAVLYFSFCCYKLPGTKMATWEHW